MRWKIALSLLLAASAARAKDTYTYVDLKEENPPPPPTAGGLRLAALLLGASGGALGGTGYWLATKDVESQVRASQLSTRLGGGMLLGTGVFLFSTGAALTGASLLSPLKNDKEAVARATTFKFIGGVVGGAGVLATCIGATQVGKSDSTPAYVLLGSGMALAGFGTGFLSAGIVVDRPSNEAGWIRGLRIGTSASGVVVDGSFD